MPLRNRSSFLSPHLLVMKCVWSQEYRVELFLAFCVCVVLCHVSFRLDQVAKATMLIGDPSYFPSRMVKPTGMVARSICIMDHPFNGTNDAESTQIIIPGRQASRSPLYMTHY